MGVVGRCLVGGLDINEWLVTQGWALAYRRYSRDYVGAEEAARAAGRGMWAGEFEPPWGVAASAITDVHVRASSVMPMLQPGDIALVYLVSLSLPPTRHLRPPRQDGTSRQAPRPHPQQSDPARVWVISDNPLYAFYEGSGRGGEHHRQDQVVPAGDLIGSVGGDPVKAFSVRALSLPVPTNT